MTDRTDPSEHTDPEAFVEDLEGADPADAPEIAENLAGLLSAELDSTASKSTSESGPSS